MNKYFLECLKLAQKAAKKKEIPVGAIVVYNNKIIGKGYNIRQKKHLVDGHAEIIAIKKASKKIKDWRLNNCTLYVTLKPCNMCETIIRESRITKVFYLLDKCESKKEYNSTSFQQFFEDDNLLKKYQNLLTNFFKENCNR